MIIRPVTPLDSAQVAEIYNHYIHTSHATFELEPVDTLEMERRILDTPDRGYPFLVAEQHSTIVGYAYGRPFRDRPGYKPAVETAVYVRHTLQRRGIGFKLYEVLISQLIQLDFHTIIAAISLPNDASIRLHEAFGFEKAAHLREAGRKFGRRFDVGYWQLLLNKDRAR